MSEDWVAYFRRYDAERAAANAPEAETDATPVILRTGRVLSEQALQHLKGAPAALVKRLRARGWEVRVGWARCFIPAVLYASNSKEGGASEYNKGDVRYPAHRLETFIVSGRKLADENSMAVEATWTRKEGLTFAFQGARTRDPILGAEWRPRASSPRPQLDWEKEEGVSPPMGLNQWLAIVAPTAAEVKKRQQAQQQLKEAA